MRSIKFIHTSDWHLGYLQYHKIERLADFFKAAEKTIEIILKEKPDFVIHTGDLFHKYNPGPGIITQTIKLLDKLKAAKIPIYLIRGNHDGSSARSLRLGGTALDLLSEIGSVIHLKDEVIEEEGYIIAGMGYYGTQTNGKFHELLKTDFDNLKKEPFTIMMLHCFVEGQMERTHDLSTFHIENQKQFDYIALGHFHQEWIDRGARIYCPGSIEHTSSNEWSIPDEDGFVRKRGLFVVEANPPEIPEDRWEISVETKYYDTRPKKKINHRLLGTTRESVHTEIITVIEDNDLEQSILNFNFTSSLPLTDQAFFVSSHYEELATKSLFTKVRIDYEGFELPSYIDDNPDVAIHKIISDLLKEKKKEDRNLIEKMLNNALDHFQDVVGGEKAKHKQEEFIDNVLMKDLETIGSVEENNKKKDKTQKDTDEEKEEEASNYSLDNWMD
ncbi:MAG: metallophosphoesterase [Candidatus Kariarchaeaceae archaeon]